MRIMQKAAMLSIILVCFSTILISGTAYAAGRAAEVDLIVEQVFQQSGSDVKGDSRFRYKLTPVNSGNPMPANPEIVIDGTNQSKMDTISFTQTGTYEYEMKMSGYPAGAGYTLDKQVYKITIYVTKTDKFLSAQVTIQNHNNIKTDEMIFTHAYNAAAATDPQLMVDPPVKKTVSGNPLKDSTFTFELTAQNKNNPMPAGSKDGKKTLSITGSGEKEFGTWSYTEAGVYYYTISEVNTGEDGYTFDTSVYTITDTVKDVKGQLELTRVVTNAANKRVESCSFINKYASGGGSDKPGGGSDKPGGGSNKPSGPKMGDDGNTAALAVIISVFSIIAAGCICYLLMDKKRNRKEALKP